MTQLASKSIDLPHNLSHTWLASIKDDWTGRKNSSDSFLITNSKHWSSILPSFLPNGISIWWRLSSLENSEMESVSRQVKHFKHHLVLLISPDVKCIALLPFIINSSVWWLFSVIVSWYSIIRVIMSLLNFTSEIDCQWRPSNFIHSLTVVAIYIRSITVTN